MADRKLIKRKKTKRVAEERKNIYSYRLQKAQLPPESETLTKTEKLSKKSMLAAIKSISVSQPQNRTTQRLSFSFKSTPHPQGMLTTTGQGRIEIRSWCNPYKNLRTGLSLRKT